MSFKNLSKYANSLLYFNRNKMKQIKKKQQIYYEFRNQLVFFHSTFPLAFADDNKNEPAHGIHATAFIYTKIDYFLLFSLKAEKKILFSDLIHPKPIMYGSFNAPNKRDLILNGTISNRRLTNHFQ